ncbi:hypothetical protein CF8_3165 [Nocardioides sp. CF8]|nr:hypothetical protein CF8_3165 [Nocardioides sp. CF8]
MNRGRRGAAFAEAPTADIVPESPRRESLGRDGAGRARAVPRSDRLVRVPGRVLPPGPPRGLRRWAAPFRGGGGEAM